MKILFIILMGIATLISLPFVFVLGLQIVWSTIYPYVEGVYSLLIILIYAYIWITIIKRVRGKRLSRKYHICFIVPILVCFSVLGGTMIYQNYTNGYDKVSNEVNLQEYEPFNSEKLAVLDEESTYKMQEPLVTLDGATAVYPLYAAFTQAVYPKGDYPLVDNDWGKVTCTTTPDAYDRLLHKEVDMIFVAAPSKEQKEEFDKIKEELVMTPIGKEAFVFFVNYQNPVKGLSSKQVKDIYSGRIKNWQEVGGEDRDIRAFQRPEGSGSQSALIRMMQGTPLMEPEKRDVASGMGDIIAQIAEYENRDNALGYSFRYYTQQMVANKDIKLLAIDGVEPTIENIRNDTYPITNQFYAIYLKSNQHKNIRPFLEWILSPQGQELVTKTGYVGLHE